MLGRYIPSRMVARVTDEIFSKMNRFIQFQYLLLLIVLPSVNFYIVGKAKGEGSAFPIRTLNLVQNPYDGLFWLFFLECIALALCLSVYLRIKKK